MVILGLAVLYLLTLRKNEEGKIEDYLRRIWKRIYEIRERALSYHLAFINGTAGAIDSILDRLFGPRFVSLQSIGVMIALALFFSNVYFLMTSFDDFNFTAERALNCLIALAFAAAPLSINKHFSPTCAQGGINPPYRPIQCRYLIKPSSHSNSVELALISFAQQWNLACLCSSTLIVIWFLGLLFYIYREYLSVAFCVFCFPAKLRFFLLIMVFVLFIIFVVAASLFVLFSLIIRLSVKKLATTKSTAKAIGLLLLGCIPIPVFAILLELVLIAIRRWVTGTQNLREWMAVGMLLIFTVVFFINALFLIIPVFFFPWLFFSYYTDFSGLCLKDLLIS